MVVVAGRLEREAEPARWREPETGAERLQTFADVGCGNGFLTYILLMEGHRGWGVSRPRSLLLPLRLPKHEHDHDHDHDPLGLALLLLLLLLPLLFQPA